MTSRLIPCRSVRLVLMAPHAQGRSATANPKQQFRTPWGDPDCKAIGTGER